MPIAKLAEEMVLAARRAYLEHFLDEGTSAKDQLDLGMLAALAVAEPRILAEYEVMLQDAAEALEHMAGWRDGSAYSAESRALAAAIRARPSAEEKSE